MMLSAPLFAVLSALTSPEPATQNDGTVRGPNVVIVFTDDQGWGDIGVQGAQGFRTPHLDRLAKEGMRLTDFYVAQPVCSASRAALLTGCYPNRIGIAGALGPNAEHGLADEEITLAELCRSRGYATAIFGKWHLGHHPRFLPTRHGFDEWLGIPYSNDMWPFHPDGPKPWVDLPLFEGESVVAFNPDQRRFTEEFTRRAVDFIDRNRGRPFFLYLPHPMPHVPLYTSEEYAGSSEQGAYGDVIQEVDASVGAVMDALDRNDLAQDTLLIFTSDNGPWLSYGNHAGSTGPLREGKGTTFEGGVRVPFLARWPGRIPAGAVSSEPAMTIDLFPTIARWIGAELPSHTIDGMDIGPILRGDKEARSPHEALFFYYHQSHLEAMRSGRWKLHFPHKYRSMAGRELGRDGRTGKYDYKVETGLALFDLEADIGETVNLAESEPEVLTRLKAMADRKRLELGDQLTGINGRNRRPAGRLEEQGR